MTHHDTFRDIVAKYAPERINQIKKKYILNITWYVTEAISGFGFVYYRDINERDDNYVFDTLEECRAFLDNELDDIRECIKDEMKPNYDIRYSVDATYEEIECIVTGADDDVDLDVFPAKFPGDSTRTAHFEWGDLGTLGGTSITYDNNESGNDRLV